MQNPVLSRRMRSRILSSALLLPLLLLAAAAVPEAAVAQEPLVPVVCYAPGTSSDVIEKSSRRPPTVSGRRGLPTSLTQGLDKYQLNTRWSVTATNGGGLTQGDPTILTWSIVPDGTSIFGYNGEPTSPSNLQAFLNGIYGSPAVWLALFQQVFDRWSELTGITYVYEPNDDGAPWLQFSLSPGVLGVRGDVRIGGHPLDGTGGVLAYNFFPNFGDMVLDTADGTYTNTSGNSLRLRNILAHEHGHGMGLNHVCPVNQTKLMEPFLSLAFDGPQHDDILGGQRHYGDTFEHNDTSATATGLGAFAPGGATQVQNVSIDDDADTNFFSLSVAAHNTATVSVTPVGLTYNQGPCPGSGTPFNSLTVHNLGVEILDTDGSTLLAAADLNPAGQGESLTDIPLPSGAGTYFVRVHGGATNSAQLYQLGLAVDGPVCGNGVLEAGETCDGADLGGQTCVSQGFSGGALSCNATCSAFVTSACYTCRNGYVKGDWNLPVSPASGKASGKVYLANHTFAYYMNARLVETSPGQGTLHGTLSLLGTTPDYTIQGGWVIVTPPGKGTWWAYIYDYPSGALVGRMAGEFKDDPNPNIVGEYGGDWGICD